MPSIVSVLHSSIRPHLPAFSLHNRGMTDISFEKSNPPPAPCFANKKEKLMLVTLIFIWRCQCLLLLLPCIIVLSPILLVFVCVFRVSYLLLCVGAVIDLRIVSVMGNARFYHFPLREYVYFYVRLSVCVHSVLHLGCQQEHGFFSYV